ncbi:MAG: tetratricopeptide repeat protein [candidate division WOR-3 bacterium]
MEIILFIIITSSWFQKDFESAKFLYESALKGKENTENPFVYFIKAIKEEKMGKFEEARNDFEKAKFFSNLEPANLFLMFIISDKKNLKEFKDELFLLLLKSKEKKGVEDIYEISEYFYKKSEWEPLFTLKIEELDKALAISPTYIKAWFKKLELYYINFKFLDFLKTFFSFSPFKRGNPLFKEIFNLAFLRVIIIFFYSLFFIFLLGVLLRKRYSIYFINLKTLSQFPESEFLPIILFLIFLFLRAPLPFYLLLIIPTIFFLELKEKIFLSVFLILIFLVSLFTIQKEPYSLSFVQDPLNPYYLKFLTMNSPYDEELLKKWDSLNIEEKNLMKSIIYMKKGEIKEAEKLLRDKFNKSSYNYLVEMGNIYFLKGKYDSASIFYREAINFYPEKFEAHFNLSQVAFQMVDLDLFQKEIDILNHIDAKKTERYIKVIKEFKLTPFLHAYPENFKKYKFKSEKVFLFVNKFIFPPLFMPLSFIILFLMFFLKGKQSIKRCKACKKVILGEVENIPPLGEVCEKCRDEILATESLKLRQRIAMRLKMKRLQKIKNILLFVNLLLPGLSFVINNSMILFLISSSIFSLGLIIIYFTSFKLFGILLYIFSFLIFLFYYLIGGKIDEAI